MKLFIKIFLLFFIFSLGFSLAGQSHSDLVKRLEQARKEKDYEKLATSYFDFGIYEEETKRNSEKSFEYFSRALEYYKVLNDTVGIYNTRFHIANHLMNNAMYKDAIQEFILLKDYYYKVDNRQRSAKVELILFELYLQNLEIKEAVNALNLSRLYLDQLEVPDPQLEIEYLIEKIKYLEWNQELDTALEMANNCFAQSAKVNSGANMALCLNRRADINFELGKYKNSIADYASIIELLNAVPYSKQLLSIYKKISECYKNEGQYKMANNYLNEYALLQDSILNENRIIALNNLTYKHESEEKSTEIRLLEKEKTYAEKSNQQQRRALTTLGIALALLLLGIYYIIQFYREKINSTKIIQEQNREINTQKIKELEDKIQINSMQSMLIGQEVERERIAKELHDSLGGLLSTIKLRIDNISNNETKAQRVEEINKATSLLDTAVEEVRGISQNLQPSALSKLGLIPSINDLINRYDSDQGPEIVFQHFDIPLKIDQTVSLGIYRIIQEILTNAIRHSQADEVFIQLNLEGDEIIIHVEDDGIGFDSKVKYKSMGLENIKSRVNYLRGTIEIDSRPKEGTSFLIHVKYKIN